MTWPKRVALVTSALGVAGVGWGLWIARRALPAEAGTVQVQGLRGSVEIVRDRWGVPHIFAKDDDDAYFALGWATAQDRLFQMEMNRRLAQGRLSEIFGARTLALDRLFRTMDFAGAGRRILARARPEALAAAEAYAHGVNANVRRMGRRLPPEFALLRIGFDEARAEDFAGILGFMAWRLNLSWAFDPLYERLVAKVGEDRAAELFPYNLGGSPSVYPARPAAPPLALSLFDVSPDAAALVSFGPSLRASNNWVVGPRKSATGRPILCNDPHMAHGLPGVWYEAHLKTSTQDVIGVTIPGFPLVVIGHNRQIAWGMTNLMVDGADFFIEKLDAEGGGRVLSHGEWTPLEKRTETIRVRGGRPFTFEVRSTPHGPLVSDLLPGETRALSYEWNFAAASQACELDAFYALDRARSWAEFRAALSRLGSIAQNVVYADLKGHIGLQAAGAIPRLTGRHDGTRFRVGWDGSEDWDGFIPFEELPSVFDPPQGWLASANNPTLPAPAPFYVSSQWEPVDRIRRIQELLGGRAKLTVEDMERIQQDTTVASAREIAPLVVAAFEGRPPRDDAVRAAIELLRGWDGDMRADRPAATLFAVLYRRLFDETFADELGMDLARAYRAQANVWAIMLRAALEGHESWFDRVDTPGVEGRDDMLRVSLEKTVDELRRTLGGEPGSWTWGRLHTLEFQHPLGRGAPILGFYFNRGPFPVPGHNQSVNKMEFGDEGFAVVQGPSMRQITDFSDLDRSLAVLPGGQSGIPASPHYADLMALWLAGRYHPLLMDREEIDEAVEGRLVLDPG
jgi:penicillin amidase